MNNPEDNIERDLGKIDPRILTLRIIANIDLETKPYNAQDLLEHIVKLAKDALND